ncbi:hypothetical protein [Stenotrophomonas phage A1432]|uniref:Uncharacterized protein n=1 Tax=Stenotrophomonas phage A1432 TaxID=2930315 RepID=A0A9E7N2T6_9CAUD|nr:hypothetical protein P9A45_gp22 [Stenotrophomonas phage A1432]UTC28008.1 hypothetical protein [Stenotrophomonas phage A1432]
MSFQQTQFLCVGGPFDGKRLTLEAVAYRPFRELRQVVVLKHSPEMDQHTGPLEATQPVPNFSYEHVYYHLQRISTKHGVLFVYSHNPDDSTLARMLLAGYRKEQSR